MSVRILPYGTWPSPLTAAHVAAEGVGSSSTLKELRVEGDCVYWLVPRPEEGGRSVVMRRDEQGTVSTLTPQPYDVRSRVHEYGGGAYGVHAGEVYFVNASDQRIYRLSDGVPSPITPEYGNRKHRFADLSISPDGHFILAVRERHQTDGIQTDLVLIPADGHHPPVSIESGRDFYSSPRLSPGGKQLAWLSWDDPAMPWDESTLWIADYHQGTLTNKRRLYAKAGVSVIQPTWNPAGVLHALLDASGWWNLYAFRDGHPEAVLPTEREIGSVPWVFGLNDYAFLDEDRLIWIAHEDGVELLERVQPGADCPVHITPEIVSFFPACLQVDSHGRIWFIGGSFHEAPHVSVYDPSTDKRERIYPAERSLPLQESLSIPSSLHIAVSPEHRGNIHTFLYPPRLQHTQAPEGDLPPLIVYAHSGPTSAARPFLQLEIQFWTSRGFAVAAVNYRGSTGFGRHFRRSLEHAWGIHDADDCLHVAEALALAGHVDPSRMVIRGRSAGGYTVLRALMRSSLFAAGTSYYGITDLIHLQSLSPKFEAHYLQHLVGKPADTALFKQRSPVHHAALIQAPLLLFQGQEDPVVPREQAERMVSVLSARDHPHEYVAIPMEGHGFRRADSIVRCLETELRFYRSVLHLE